MGRKGMGRKGMGRKGMGRNGMGREGDAPAEPEQRKLGWSLALPLSPSFAF
jgi:hypothetical protein